MALDIPCYIMVEAILNGSVHESYTHHNLITLRLISNSMNKADIISKVHEVLGGTKVEAERAVDAMFGSIEEAMKDGTAVSVAGFGIFEAKMRAKREARNPRTGETVTVPAMRVPKCCAAKALKDAVK